MIRSIEIASAARARSSQRRVAALAAAALLTTCAVAGADQGGSACADKVVADLRTGKVTDVAGLLVEPPSYAADQAAKDRQAAAVALRAVLSSAGAVESAAPMAARRRYYRVLISGGEPEAWATIGRPMVAAVVERDVRFAQAGAG